MDIWAHAESRADEGRLMMEGSQNHSNMKHMVRLLLRGINYPTDHVKAGYTYCAISALSLLHRLPDSSAAISSKPQIHDPTPSQLSPGLTNLPATIRWLVSRQLEYFPPGAEDEDKIEQKTLLPSQEERHALVGIFKNVSDPPDIASLSLNDSHFVGFNGRSNKRADTCYAFWVAGSLAVCTSP